MQNIALIRPAFWRKPVPGLALAAIMFVWTCWLIYLSTSMLAHYTGIPALCCCLVLVLLHMDITVGKQHFVLSRATRYGIDISLTVGTVLYQFAVQHWGFQDMAFLVAPLVVLPLRAAVIRFRKAKQQSA